MKKSLLLRSCAFLAMPMAANAIFSTAAEAQQITTGIVGQVTSESGQPVPNAQVTVTDTRTGAKTEISANEQGQFSAQGLVTGGPYTVTATADGFQGQTVENITTSLQGETQLTFSLTPATAQTASDTIVVTGTRARLTQLEVGPGTSYGIETLENAPSFNRDVRDVIRLDPRVSLDREDSATGGSGADRISCLGGNDRGNAFTVDGILQGDIYGLNDTGFSSRSSTPIPYDAVRETQVQFAPFDVEYGQFTGCAINVVTKSGSNRFRGEAFFEYSSDSLRGETVKGRTLAPIDDDKRWGAALGGPIWRDRLFFFGAYEHQEGGFAQETGPNGAGYPNELAGVSLAQYTEIESVIRDIYGIDMGGLVTNRPYNNDRYFGRLDFQINDDHRLEATYQRLEESTVQPDDFATSTFPQNVVGLNTFYLSGTKSDYYSGRLYSNWTDRLSTELRYSRSDIIDIQDPVGGGEAQDAEPIIRIIVGVDNPGVDGTVQAGPGFSRSANDLQTKIDQYRALLKYDAGDHKLKIGFELNRADIANLFVQNAFGTLTFRNVTDLRNGLLSPGTGSGIDTFPNTTGVIGGTNEGAYGNYSRTGDVWDAAGYVKRDIYTVYAQDDWRVTDRLNLVAGVRADFFSGSAPDENPLFVQRYGFSNSTGFDALDPIVLPRLGFTWDMSEFAMFERPKLQGGIGYFSGGDPLVWFGNAFQNNGFGFAEGTTQDASCPASPIDVVVNGVFTGLPSCIRAVGAARAARGEGDAQSINPDIKSPTVFRANLGFGSTLNFASTGFFSDWRINVDYIYSHYMNPYSIVDLSQTPAIFGGTTGSGTGQLPAPIGLSGYTIDGRPIYRAIEPSNVGCDAVLAAINPAPVWTNVTAQCFFNTTSTGAFARANNGNLVGVNRDDELMLTNVGGYDSHIISGVLSKNWNSGILTPGGNVFFSAGYAYTNAQDRRNMFNSTAGSNYDQTAAFDRQNPAASRGFFESRHNITLNARFSEEFFPDLDTTFGLNFVARSGRPYSLTFNGSGVFNDSASGSNNSLIYLPTGTTDPNIAPTSNMTAVTDLVNFASSLNCAAKYLGRTVPRNSCTNDWYYDLDLRFSQELPGFSRATGIGGVRDSIRVYAMFDNFLNLLKDSWNVQYRRNFAGLQVIGNTSGVDSQGRYIITALPGGQTPQQRFDQDRFINFSGSVWRLKVGVSYQF
ncbi:MAG TPA: TonB-dependent receptor [Sphingomicrobium sp.]|nr:TonB-dependent receptor [Sphingomicrobium sp.]